jgi:hypothetical protein
MTTLELIIDASLFGGNIPNKRIKECRDFFDKIKKQQKLNKKYTEKDMDNAYDKGYSHGVNRNESY